MSKERAAEVRSVLIIRKLLVPNHKFLRNMFKDARDIRGRKDLGECLIQPAGKQ